MNGEVLHSTNFYVGPTVCNSHLTVPWSSRNYPSCLIMLFPIWQISPISPFYSIPFIYDLSLYFCFYECRVSRFHTDLYISALNFPCFFNSVSTMTSSLILGKRKIGFLFFEGEQRIVHVCQSVCVCVCMCFIYSSII